MTTAYVPNQSPRFERHMMRLRPYPVWRVYKHVPDICPYTQEPTIELLQEAESFTPQGAKEAKLKLEQGNPTAIYVIEETHTWI